MSQQPSNLIDEFELINPSEQLEDDPQNAEQPVLSEDADQWIQIDSESEQEVDEDGIEFSVMQSDGCEDYNGTQRAQCMHVTWNGVKYVVNMYLHGTSGAATGYGVGRFLVTFGVGKGMGMLAPVIIGAGVDITNFVLKDSERFAGVREALAKGTDYMLCCLPQQAIDFYKTYPLEITKGVLETGMLSAMWAKQHLVAPPTSIPSTPTQAAIMTTQYVLTGIVAASTAGVTLNKIRKWKKISEASGENQPLLIQAGEQSTVGEFGKLKAVGTLADNAFATPVSAAAGYIAVPLLLSNFFPSGSAEKLAFEKVAQYAYLPMVSAMLAKHGIEIITDKQNKTVDAVITRGATFGKAGTFTLSLAMMIYAAANQGGSKDIDVSDVFIALNAANAVAVGASRAAMTKRHSPYRGWENDDGAVERVVENPSAVTDSKDSDSDDEAIYLRDFFDMLNASNEDEVSHDDANLNYSR